MEDEWELTVDIFSVEMTFVADIEEGARIVHAECDCDTEPLATDGGEPEQMCRHTRLASARILTVFDDRPWAEVRGRKGLPDDEVAVVEAPAQWSPLIDTGGE
jgi:hypothetical protein